MATAAEIAQACRQLANQVQSVHIPQMHAVVSEVGSQVDHLAAEGDEIFQMGLQPVQSSFHALAPHFQAITSFLEEHPSHLLRLAIQLDAIAGNNLVAGAVGAAVAVGAAGAGNFWSSDSKFRAIFDPVNTALGTASLIAYLIALHNLDTNASDVAASIARQMGDAFDATTFDRSASIAASIFGRHAASDVRSGGLEGILEPLGASAKAAGGVGAGLGAVAIFGDAMILHDPGQKGTAGEVDRVAAGANMAGTLTAVLAANAAADWVPGVGEVVAAGSGIYLTGDYLYQNVPVFRHATNDVYNTLGPVGLALTPMTAVAPELVAGAVIYHDVPEVRHATDDVANAAGTAGGDIVSKVGTGLSGASKGIGKAAGSVWHAL